MREDPYPARFYGRLVDEPFMTEMVAALPHPDHANPLQQPMPRVLLLLLTIYLGCAIFLIFTVTSYAAPLDSAATPAEAAGCIEIATIAAY